LTLPLKKRPVSFKHYATRRLHPIIGVVMGDRYATAYSTYGVSGGVVKIIVVNLPRSSSPIATSLGSVGLYLDVVTVIMTVYPSSTVAVVG
jgi:hypothetical protein